MRSTRRDFVTRIGLSGLGELAVAGIAGRGRESSLEAAMVPNAAAPAQDLPPKASTIRLDSNENPNGPAPPALDAMRGAFGIANRYPDAQASDLREAIARRHGVAVENVATGCGSTEILKAAASAFASKGAPFVTAAPSFEAPARFADASGAQVIAVPVTGGLFLDLDAMAARAEGAGLVYVCNPNNPTATHRSAADVKAFVARAATGSTTVLVDEAYFDYVEDPSYGTAVPLAMENPRVIVARTFSKIFGLAGLRAGYAVGQAPTIEKLRRHLVWDSINAFAGVAGVASLAAPGHVEAQRKLNHEAREFTRAWFEKAGFKVYPSEANFMMVDVRRDSRTFRDACRARGVSIGRPFPPLTTCARISVGTLDEMREACEVFKAVLA